MRSYIPKSPKITSLLFLCNIWKNKWVMVLIFCMQKSMKASNWYSDFWWSSFRKVPKIATLPCLCSISKKKLKLKSIFCMQINLKFPTSWFQQFRHQSCYKVIVLLLVVVIKHSQSTQSNKFAILHNIQKKEVRDGVLFCMHVNIKVSKSCYYCFSWKWPEMPKLPKVRLLLFKTFRYTTGVLSYLLLLSASNIVLNIRIFYGGLVMFAVT